MKAIELSKCTTQRIQERLKSFAALPSMMFFVDMRPFKIESHGEIEYTSRGHQ
jgi:hypothetical protein